MIQDVDNSFDAAVLVTDAKVSTNVLDLGSITEAGAGTPLYINVYCDTAFSSDDKTIQVDLITSTGVPTAANTLLTVLMPTAVDSISGLHAAGLLAKVPIPSTGLQRYIALAYVVPTVVATGKLTAFLTLE